MIRFSDISGNPVLSTATATTVGRVAAPVIDPKQRKVVAFRVRKSKGAGDLLLWSGMTALGPDAVTVDSQERLTDPPAELKDRSSGKLDVIGRRVLTETGRDLGPVKDVEFDQADGTVTSLVLKSQFVAGDRLLGIGHYAVVVAS